MTITVRIDLPSATSISSGTFTDVLPSGLRFASTSVAITGNDVQGSSTITCNSVAPSFTTLPCSSSVSSTCTQVMVSGIFSNFNQVKTCTYVFSVVATTTGVQTNPQFDITSTKTVSGVPQQFVATVSPASVAVTAGVTATKSFATSTMAAGSSTTATIRFENTSPYQITSITFTDTLQNPPLSFAAGTIATTGVCDTLPPTLTAGVRFLSRHFSLIQLYSRQHRSHARSPVSLCKLVTFAHGLFR